MVFTGAAAVVVVVVEEEAVEVICPPVVVVVTAAVLVVILLLMLEAAAAAEAVVVALALSPLEGFTLTVDFLPTSSGAALVPFVVVLIFVADAALVLIIGC